MPNNVICHSESRLIGRCGPQNLYKGFELPRHYIPPNDINAHFAEI